jgi:hypothetical protein
VTDGSSRGGFHLLLRRAPRWFLGLLIGTVWMPGMDVLKGKDISAAHVARRRARLEALIAQFR